MVYNGRHYAFYYDKRGRVDYIDVSEPGLAYLYQVTYKNNKLFSAALVEEGAVISENHDFKFDKKRNITQFTYTLYVEDVPGGVHFVTNFAYDEENRITSIYSTDISLGNSLLYDDHDNIVKWTDGDSETTYTYDEKFNPLNFIPDLFALFVEEAFYWEYILSKHNMATRSHIPNVSNPLIETTTYKNEYDQFFRLIKKTDEEGNEFLFLYE